MIRKNTASAAFAGMLLLTGCNFQKETSVTLVKTDSGEEHPASAASLPATGFALSAGPAQVMNLGESGRIVTLMLSAARDFSGPVQLTVDNTELSQVDPAGYISATVSPSSVTLSPATAVPVQVTLQTDTLAPSFNGKLTLRATETSGGSRAQVASADIPLQVRATYVVKLKGGRAPEQWEAPSMLNFRPHAEGMTIQFVNFDSSTTHVVHGSGAIPHGDSTRPLSVATGGVPQTGGTYNVTVRPGTVSTGQYYCHVHESSTAAHNVTFNYGADRATYTSIAANILSRKCTSCHGGANGTAGGVNLMSYGATLNAVTVGRPLVSALFTSVQNNSMPNNGSPLTNDEKMAIYDWILAGAPNN